MNKEKFMRSFILDHETGCWEWLRGRRPNGYGVAWYKGKQFYAHRLMWEMMFGEIHGDLCVCHHCDNPGCINPDHLFVGTHKDNARDRCQKGRSGISTGEHNGQSRLSEEDVLEILRIASNGGMTQGDIGKMFGICRTAVNRIIGGSRWSHIDRR